MNFKHPRKFVGALFVIFFILACEQRAFQAHQNSHSSHDTLTGIEIPLPDEACYPSICFSTISKTAIGESEVDYQYLNPDDFSNESQRRFYVSPTHVIDLKNMNPDMAVATHFKLRDFMSEAKGRYGIFSPEVVTRLQDLRNHIGRPIVINSGYRSPGYNRRISGAAKWSRHTYGDAVDFYVPGQSVDSLLALCDVMGASFRLAYQTHMHCDWRFLEPGPPFFDSQVILEFEKSSRESFTNLISASASFDFHFDGNTLTVTPRLGLLESEDAEGELLYSWTVAHSKGLKTTANTKSISIERTGGSITLRLLIGGTIELNEQIEW